MMSFYSQQSADQGEHQHHEMGGEMDDDRGGAHYDGQQQEDEPRTKLVNKCIFHSTFKSQSKLY